MLKEISKLGMLSPAPVHFFQVFFLQKFSLRAQVQFPGFLGFV